MVVVRIDQGVLRDGAAALGDAGSRLDGAWQELRGWLAATGDVFGEDAVGGLIGASHGAAERIAADSVSSIVTALGGYGLGVERRRGPVRPRRVRGKRSLPPCGRVTMSITIPPALAHLLNDVGFVWPMTDEDRLHEIAQRWIQFAPQLAAVGHDADAAAGRVVTANAGPCVEAFQTSWAGAGAARDVLQSGEVGVRVIGACLLVCSAVVVALKINVITQLAILAVEVTQALLTVVATAGASLAELVVFKKLTGMAINFLVTQALAVILG